MDNPAPKKWMIWGENPPFKVQHSYRNFNIAMIHKDPYNQYGRDEK